LEGAKVLKIENLSKAFGAHKVLDDISFSVPEGSVFGFVGANGAGKTTTMKLILGLLAPDSGSMYICGERVSFGSSKTNRHIGYLPDVPEYYNYMRPREYLKLCGEITRMSAGTIKARTDELLQLVGLATNKRIGDFSRGMKQRLGVAQALLNKPKLLICDEPTSALDPVGRKEILDILREIKGTTTVIFSTHILSDVERVSDSAAVLNKGKIVLNGSLNELKTRHGSSDTTIRFETAADREKFFALPDIHTHYSLFEQGETSVTVSAASIESLLMEAFA
jgi:ABC-2 type transport system ATP-binding protein